MGKLYKNILLRTHEAQGLYIYYVVMFSGPLKNPANQAPGVQTGHAPGVIISHRLIMGKT